MAIALGANLGDRRANLEYAVQRLSVILRGVRVSTFIESEPVEVASLAPESSEESGAIDSNHAGYAPSPGQTDLGSHSAASESRLGLLAIGKPERA